MIEIKMIGDWRGAKRGLQELPFMVKSSALWGQRKAAERLVKIVKAHINNQDLGWAPRSANTSSNDPRTLVDNEDYYKNIKAWRKNELYYAGVPRDKYNGKGVRISDYATIHEHGAKGLPARPLWAPSFQEVGGAKGIRAIIVDSIYAKVRNLRAKGFDVTIGKPFV
jgi:hypothetical protein